MKEDLSKLSDQELLDMYESTYDSPDIKFVEPTEPLVDNFILNKLSKIHNTVMKPKEEGGLDADWWTVIVGNEGTGKSTFTNNFLYHYSKIANVDFVNTTIKNTAFDEFDMMRLISGIDIEKPYQFIWADEGANIFFNRSSNTTARKYTVKFSNSMRFLHYMVAICSVEMSQLDVIFKNHRIKSLIRIENQGTYHYYNYRQLKTLMHFSKGLRDSEFPWHKVPPEHIGWFKQSNETKKVVDSLKKNYLKRFQIEARREYVKMVKKKLLELNQ